MLDNFRKEKITDEAQFTNGLPFWANRCNWHNSDEDWD